MRTTARLAAGTAVVLGVSLAGGTAHAVDAPYSGEEVEVLGTDVSNSEVGGSVAARTDGATSSGAPTSLPFTGGEVTLVALLAGAALASGGALVVAGRRRADVQA